MKAEDFLYHIREVYESHYCVRIDLDYEDVIYKAFDSSYKYVWILQHSEYISSWTPSGNMLYSSVSNPDQVLVRNDVMEILMDTQAFCDVLKRNRLHHEIFIQTNIMPPNYLTADKFTGKKRYDMFKQCVDYLFEMELESDYICITSSRKEVLENILDKIGVPFRKDNEKQ